MSAFEAVLTGAVTFEELRPTLIFLASGALIVLLLAVTRFKARQPQ